MSWYDTEHISTSLMSWCNGINTPVSTEQITHSETMETSTSTYAASPATKPKKTFWRMRCKEKAMAKSMGKTTLVKPRQPTLLLTSSHGLEHPPHRPGMPRPPWMLVDAYGGKKSFHLKAELPTKTLPKGLKHAVVMLGGNDISVPRWRRRTSKKPNSTTVKNTATNLVEIYRHLKEDRRIERVTIVALLPRPSDDAYLPCLVEATNRHLEDEMFKNGSCRDLFIPKGFTRGDFYDGTHLSRQGYIHIGVRPPLTSDLWMTPQAYPGI